MITIQQQVSTPVYPAIILIPNNVGSGGTSADGVDFRTVQKTDITGAATWKNYSISVPAVGFSVTNNSPTTLDFDDPTQLKRITGSTGSIRISDRYGFSWLQTVNYNYSSSGNYSLPRGYTTGSIPKFCYDIISPLLVSGKDLNYFSTVNHSTGTYTQNTNCWASGFDLSGVSVWTSRSGDFRRACTAITRRHCRMAWHYRLSPGDTVKFRRPNGIVDTHTVIAVNPGGNHPDFPDLHENTSVCDMCVILLDRDLHESIRVYPIAEWAMDVIALPAENPAPEIIISYGLGAWMTYDSDVHFSAALIYLNQQRQICPLYMANLDSAAIICGKEQAYGSGTIPIWACFFFLDRTNYTANSASDFRTEINDWQVDVVGGDSSSPIFCPTGGDGLAFVTCFTTATAGMAPNVEVHNVIIAATDSAAGVTTGYTATSAPDPTL